MASAPTFIIHDPVSGDTETHEFGDVTFALAAFPRTARVFEITFDAKADNMVSTDITRHVVMRGIEQGYLTREDEITHKYHDWPETVTIGDQEYYRTEKGLVAA